MRRPGIILTFNREESNKTPLGVAVGKKERKEALRLSRKDAAVLAHVFCCCCELSFSFGPRRSATRDTRRAS